MDTIFINSESTKMPEPHDLRRGEKSIALSNLSIHYMWKNIKGSYSNNMNLITITYNNTITMINLNYQMDHILYQIFKIILSVF